MPLTILGAEMASAAVYNFRSSPWSVTAAATLRENCTHSSACRIC